MKENNQIENGAAKKPARAEPGLTQPVENNLGDLRSLHLKTAGARQNEGEQKIVFLLTKEGFHILYGFLVNSGIGGCESAPPKFEKYFAPHKNET